MNDTLDKPVPSSTNGSTATIQPADWRAFAEDLLKVRTAVFVDEQSVPPELEIDGLDDQCFHVRAVTASGETVGTARLLPDFHIGRMSVLKPWRGQNIGAAMLQYLISEAQHRGAKEVILSAQVSAIGFYQKFDFQIISEPYLDAGIKHVDMRKIF